MIKVHPRVEEYHTEKGNIMYTLFVDCNGQRYDVHTKPGWNVPFDSSEIYNIMSKFVAGMNFSAMVTNMLIDEDIYMVGEPGETVVTTYSERKARSVRLGSKPERIWEYTDQNGTHVITDQEIIDEYFDNWSEKVRNAGRDQLATKDRCIEDWVLCHFAYEKK